MRGEPAPPPPEPPGLAPAAPACSAAVVVAGASRSACSLGSSGQVVDGVEDLAEVAADPVQGVHQKRVAWPGVGEHLRQPLAVGGRAGLLVDVDRLFRDALRAERVELEALRITADMATRELTAAWQATTQPAIPPASSAQMAPGDRVLTNAPRRTDAPAPGTLSEPARRRGSSGRTGRLRRGGPRRRRRAACRGARSGNDRAGGRRARGPHPRPSPSGCSGTRRPRR